MAIHEPVQYLGYADRCAGYRKGGMGSHTDLEVGSTNWDFVLEPAARQTVSCEMSSAGPWTSIVSRSP
jgi:hypothetical protein